MREFLEYLWGYYKVVSAFVAVVALSIVVIGDLSDVLVRAVAPYFGVSIWLGKLVFYMLVFFLPGIGVVIGREMKDIIVKHRPEPHGGRGNDGNDEG